MCNNVAIVQARNGSKRLPGKIFLQVGNLFLVDRVIKGLQQSSEIDKVVIATTTSRSDDKLVKWCSENKIDFFRGSENNVLKRFYDCAVHYKVQNVIRITADDPFKDPAIIDQMLLRFYNERLDFLCNNNPPTFPEGLDVEIFSFETLKMMHFMAENDFQREHVTQYAHKYKHKFKFENFKSNNDYSKYRLTIDNQTDLKFCNELCSKVPTLSNQNIPIQNIIDVLEKNKTFALSNITECRSERYNKNF